MKVAAVLLIGALSVDGFFASKPTAVKVSKVSSKSSLKQDAKWRKMGADVAFVRTMARFSSSKDIVDSMDDEVETDPRQCGDCDNVRYNGAECNNKCTNEFVDCGSGGVCDRNSNGGNEDVDHRMVIENKEMSGYEKCYAKCMEGFCLNYCCNNHRPQDDPNPVASPCNENFKYCMGCMNADTQVSSIVAVDEHFDAPTPAPPPAPALSGVIPTDVEATIRVGDEAEDVEEALDAASEKGAIQGVGGSKSTKVAKKAAKKAHLAGRK